MTPFFVDLWRLSILLLGVLILILLRVEKPNAKIAVKKNREQKSNNENETIH